MALRNSGEGARGTISKRGQTGIRRKSGNDKVEAPAEESKPEPQKVTGLGAAGPVEEIGGGRRVSRIIRKEEEKPEEASKPEVLSAKERIERARKEREEEEARKNAPTGRRSRRATVAVTKPSVRSKVDSTDSDNSSGSARVSRRSVRKDGPLITTKTKVLTGLVLLLIFGVIVGWSPAMKQWKIMRVNGGDKSAAEELVAWLQPANFLPIFEERLGHEDPAVREVAAYGIGIAIPNYDAYKRLMVMETVKRGFMTYENQDDVRLILSKEVLQAARRLAKAQGSFSDKKIEEQHAQAVDELSQILLHQLDKEKQPQIRLNTISGLGLLPSHTAACAKLIEIAKNGNIEEREIALEGIPVCAYPDRAGINLNALLEHLTIEDEALANAARAGFHKVRDGAATQLLLPMLENENPKVRLEIVKAFSTRKTDEFAANGVFKALKDGNAEVREAAVAAIPNMKLQEGAYMQLSNLLSDTETPVRLAAAQTIAQLNDETSWQALMRGFASAPSGEVLKTFLETLGKRGMARNNKTKKKDFSAIELGMKYLSQDRDTAALALAQLTTVPGYGDRVATRRAWSAEQWHEWYRAYQARERRAQAAIAKLNEAKSKAGMQYQSEYPALGKQVQAAVDELQACADQCVDDPEDKAYYQAQINDVQMLQYHFNKNQTVDMYSNRPKLK